MNSWKGLSETRLPDKEMFYSKLNDEHLTYEENAHAQRVWEAFGCKTLGNYHAFFVKKKSKSDFKKDFYKLMNNSVFGKTTETEIVRNNETDRLRRFVASPLYSRNEIFSNDMVGVDFTKPS